MLTSPLYEERILRVAALVAMECGGSWIMKLWNVSSPLDGVVLELRRYMVYLVEKLGQFRDLCEEDD